MDNSFDKLNAEFADVSNAKRGFKYWFWLVWSYLFTVIGLAIGVFALMPERNKYLSLLTLLCGLFAVQTAAWGKGPGHWDKPLRVGQLAGIVVVAFAAVILYIILPILNG